MKTLTVEGEALRVPLRGEMVAFGSEGSLVRACVQGQGVEQRPLPDARRAFYRRQDRRRTAAIGAGDERGHEAVLGEPAPPGGSVVGGRADRRGNRQRSSMATVETFDGAEVRRR
jgi:hypothetical protein